MGWEFKMENNEIVVWDFLERTFSSKLEMLKFFVDGDYYEYDDDLWYNGNFMVEIFNVLFPLGENGEQMVDVNFHIWN